MVSLAQFLGAGLCVVWCCVCSALLLTSKFRFSPQFLITEYRRGGMNSKAIKIENLSISVRAVDLWILCSLPTLTKCVCFVWVPLSQRNLH